MAPVTQTFAILRDPTGSNRGRKHCFGRHGILISKAKTHRKRKKAAGETARAAEAPQPTVATRPGANGGTLMAHAPGSNGGVHRGPDKGIRRNVVRAILIGALADAGLSIEDVVAALEKKRRKSDGKLPHRRSVELIPMAMVQHLKTGLKNIARDAALGDKDAYGPLLRLLEGAHTILQPQKDETANGKTPTPAKFIYTDDLQAPQAIDAAAPEQGGAVTDRDGKVYV